MDSNTGIDIIKELIELEKKVTVEWGPIQQNLLIHVNSLQPILSEEELLTAAGTSDFLKMRDELLKKYRELMKDVREFGDGLVTNQILDRKNEIVRNFEEASVTLAEANQMHRELTIIPKDFSLEVARTLLIPLSNLQEISSDICGTLPALNNHHTLMAKTKTWKERISKTWSALTDIHMLIPSYRLQQNHLEQFIALLTRVEQLHRPIWYFNFVEAVGGNVIEEIQQFRVNMEEYNIKIGELFTEIKQFLEYQ